MADNITLNTGTGGATLAADDITSVWYQIVKLAHGALDSATLVSTSSGLPVQQQGTWTVGLSAGTATNEVVGDAAHDAASAGNPLLMGAYAKAAAPTDVSADGDAVNLWALRNGALAVNVTAAGALVGGDATNGLDVDVTRVTGTVTIAGAVTNAGTFAVQVDGSALTALQLIDNLVLAEDAAHGSGDPGVMLLAKRTDTAPAATSGADGDYEPLQVAGGRLWASATIDAALPAGTNAIGKLAANTGVDIGDVDVTSVVPGTGATNLGKAEDAAHTSADTGVYVLAVRDDTPAAHSGADGDYESMHVNADGGLWVTPVPSETAGLTIFRSIDLDETEEEVSATACTVYSALVTNTATSTRFIKFYNATAANTTVGTTTPVITWGIPGNSSDDVAAVMNLGEYGVGFATALSVAATTGVADNDTGAPGANEVVVNIFYKN